jgi:hypothetical protein
MSHSHRVYLQYQNILELTSLMVESARLRRLRRCWFESSTQVVKSITSSRVVVDTALNGATRLSYR